MFLVILHMTNTFGMYGLMMTVVKRQLRKLGHNLRKNCTTIPHTYALYMPSHGKRKRGRPRLEYLQYIENVTGLKGVQSIVDTAQNRENWRMLVVDCGSCAQPPWVSEWGLISTVSDICLYLFICCCLRWFDRTPVQSLERQELT